ncbi:MAG TPA: hypothetical protein VMU65_12485 [Candidatus Saccharimonadales bacterium]|nr:hypothetical protein [Candidatus Saccharimonadales bacterium]
MSRITRITGPDGSTTTITQKSSCGCLTFLAFLVVIFGPAAWFGSWAVAAYVGLALLVVVPLIIAAIVGWRSGRNMHGTPLDGPEKDAAYWAEYVARASGNPEPPPVPPIAHPPGV